MRPTSFRAEETEILSRAALGWWIRLAAEMVLGEPGRVSVSIEEDRDLVLFVLRAAAEDLPQLLGRDGEVGESLRLLVEEAGSQAAEKYRLCIGWKGEAG